MLPNSSGDGCKGITHFFIVKEVILEGECNLRIGDEFLVLLKDMQFLEVNRCNDLRSLCGLEKVYYGTLSPCQQLIW